jgi:hypothetical protein
MTYQQFVSQPQQRKYESVNQMAVCPSQQQSNKVILQLNHILTADGAGQSLSKTRNRSLKGNDIKCY